MSEVNVKDKPKYYPGLSGRLELYGHSKIIFLVW